MPSTIPAPRPKTPARRTGLSYDAVMNDRGRLAPLVLALALLRCAHTFPPDYGLNELRADSARWPGEALVHSLTRPRGDPSACLSSNFRRMDDELVDPLVAALGSPTLPAATWGTCVTTLLPTLPPLSRRRFFDRLSSRTLDLVEQGRRVPLETVLSVLIDRQREASKELHELLERLQTARDVRPDLAPVVAALKEVLELDEGRLSGAPLTPDRTLTLDDEVLLRRVINRAFDEAVRVAARRRIIRLHLASSPVPEVKNRAAAVEAAVMQSGRWVQPLASLPPAIMKDPLTLPTALRASQNVSTQLVRLTVGDDEAPRIDLTADLRFSVGFSQPLGLCRPPQLLDVTPCIDAREVQLGTGFAKLTGDGALEFPETLAMVDLVELVRAGLGLVVPIELAGRRVQVLQVPITVLQPGAFFFEGAAKGPAVNVVVVPVTQGLLVDAVDEQGSRRQVVVPRAPTAFELGSRGGRGTPGTSGSPGANGSRGSNGMTASCPSSSGTNGGAGTNGGRGGDGGRGGPGGAGGPVKVSIECGKDCEDEALVRAFIRSRGGLGGPGGQGGPGGRGGDGGSGGSGTSCYSNGRTTSLSGGSNGARGSDGARGSNGAPGPPGLDGPVQVLAR